MLQQRHTNRRGTATVELAVALPVFVAILLATIECCTFIFVQQSLEIAAYEAARVAIVPKTTSSDISRAVQPLLTARRIKDAAIQVTPEDFQSAAYGTFIRVDVSAPCNTNSVLPLSYFGSRTLIGSVEMMKEF